MVKSKFKTALVSIKRHPLYWSAAFLFSLFVGDFAGRGLIEKGGSVVMVVSEWWSAIEWIFEHPIGESALLVLAGWLVYRAISNVMIEETKKQQALFENSDAATARVQIEIESTIQERLGRYDKKLDALFTTLTQVHVPKEIQEIISQSEEAIDKVYVSALAIKAATDIEAISSFNHSVLSVNFDVREVTKDFIAMSRLSELEDPTDATRELHAPKNAHKIECKPVRDAYCKWYTESAIYLSELRKIQRKAVSDIARAKEDLEYGE